jgi:lipid-binding SYLF domain-containing protein
MKKTISIFLTLLALTPAVSHTEERRERENMRASMAQPNKEQRELIKSINNATVAYDQIVFRGPNGGVPKSIQQQAKCVAVFPGAVTAAVVVGGMHGKGVVSCKNAGKWSTPSFANINAASVGAQVGGKSTDYVFFINSDEAVSKLKQGQLDVNADAGFVMGGYDASTATTSAGVVGYQKSGGGFMGASIGASTISIDDKSNKELYGKHIVGMSLLDGAQTGESDAAKNFVNKLPHIS